MISTASPHWGRVAMQATVAGLVGAVLFDLFLWVTTVVPQHASMLGVWQYIASTAFGKVALDNPAWALVGLAMHLVVSIAWAGGYAYLAATRPFLNRRWIVSGFAYGLVVYLVMQVALLAGGSFVLPAGPRAVAIALAAHSIFFGIPVAGSVSALQSWCAA